MFTNDCTTCTDTLKMSKNYRGYGKNVNNCKRSTNLRLKREETFEEKTFTASFRKNMV